MTDITSNLPASTNPAQPIRCRHIKVDGTQCGCPALAGRLLCYFHYNWQLSAVAAIKTSGHHIDDYCDKDPKDLLLDKFGRPTKKERAELELEAAIRADLTRERCEDATLLLPILEDANSIQVALMKVMRLLLANAIPYKTAGLLFYGLQTASANLAGINFQPPGEQVTTVPFTVPVHGPYERSEKKDPVDDAGPIAKMESGQSNRVLGE
jgi:hypothetical protein